MPTLGTIISRMRAAGESQENIDATRAEYERLNTPKPAPSLFKNPTAGLELPRGNPEPTSPTDFWGGFAESLRSGEAFETGMQGLKGFAKGAIYDLPSSIAGGAKLGADLLSFGDPQRQVAAGKELFEGLRALPGHIAETTRFAGSRPEEFGRMTGQLLGQPIVGEAAVAGGLGAARALRRPTANLLSSVGRGLEGAKPVKGMPVTQKGLVSEAIRGATGPVGRTMQRTGEAMRMKAFAQSGAKAAAGEAIPLKPGVPARPAISPRNVPPPPSQVPLGTQPPLAETESLTDYARRGGSGSNPVPPSAFGERPIPSEADPMFLSPEAPPAPPSTGTMFEGGGVIDTPNVNINQTIPPAPPPPPTQTAFGGGGVIDTPNMRFRQGSPVEPTPPPAAPTPAPKFEPTTDPATFAPEDVELMKAKKAQVREILERLRAKEEGVNPTTGEIIEPAPPPEPAPAPTSKPRKTRSKGKWNLSKAEPPPAEPKATVEPDAFAQPGPEAPPAPPAKGGVVEPVAQRPSLFGDERGAVKFWGEGLEGGPRRRPTLNRGMFERSARIGAEESAAARPKSVFSDAVSGANEFSPDVVQGSENVLEGTSPTFEPRQSFADIQNRMFELVDKGTTGTLTAEELAEAQALNKVWRNHPEFSADKPFSEFDKARLQKMKGKSNKSAFSQRVKDFMKDESGEIDFGESKLGKRGVADFEPPMEDVGEGLSLPKLQTPRYVEGESALQFIKRYLWSEESPFKPLADRMNPTDAEAIERFNQLPGSVRNGAMEMWKEVQAKGARPAADVVPMKRPGLLEDERGAVGKNIGPQNKPTEPNLGPAKPTPSNLVSNLVKSGDVVRSQVKNVGPKGQTFKVTGPDGKSLGTINVTNERVAEVLKAYGGDGNPDEIAKLIYETDLDDILDQAKVRYKKENMDSSELKVDTVDNRTTKAPAKPAAEAPKEKLPYPFGPKEEAAPVDTEATGAPTEGAGGYGPKGVSDKLSSAVTVTPGKSAPEKIDLTAIYEGGSSIRPISNEAGRLDSIKAPDAKYRGLLPKNMRYELKVGETYRERLKWVVDNLMAGENMTPEAEAIRMKEMDAFNESVKKSIGMDKPSDIPPLDPKKVDLTKLRPGKINQQPAQWISPRFEQQYPDMARRLREAAKNTKK